MAEEILRKAYTQLGEKLVPNLRFSGDNTWERMFEAGNGSQVLIDATLVRNSLLLMDEGLASQDSFNAALLPDLSTLFFTLTHFEDVLLLDHGLTASEQEKIEKYFGSVIRRIDVWGFDFSRSAEFYNEILGKFNQIQKNFRITRSLHKEWGSAWSTLLNDAKVRPVYFSDHEIKKLIASPFNMLAAQMEGVGMSFRNALKGKVRTIFGFEDKNTELSLFASYHTFRAIFYSHLSDEFRIPYVSCGVRTVASSFIPYRYLRRNRIAHETPFTLETIAARAIAEDMPPEVQLPLLKVSPTLAVVLRRMADYGSSVNWPNLVKELRADSREYRGLVSEFASVSGRDEFDADRVSEIAAQLRKSRFTASASASVLGVVGTVVDAILKRDIVSGVKLLKELLSTEPGLLMTNFMTRRRLRFMLRAKDIAAENLALESQCKRTWGRRFSDEERTYLFHLTQLRSSLFA